MNKSRADMAWKLLSLAVAEVLIPLHLIVPALVVSVGYVLTLLIPVSIDIWAALLLVSTAIALALLIVRARGLWPSRPAERFSWRCFLPLFPLLLVLPPSIATLLWPSFGAIAHIDLQFPFVIQVFNRVSPYESVVAPGYPSNQYWLLFAFAAAFIRVASLDIYSGWLLVNLATVLATNYWIGRILVELNIARKGTLRLGLMTLFCFCALNLAGIFSVLGQALNGVVDPGRVDFLLLPGADYRHSTTILTVVHGRGLAPGITAFAAALYLLISLLRKRADILSFVMFYSAGLYAAAVMPTLTFFVVAVLLGSLGLIALYALLTHDDRREGVIALWRMLAAGISPPRLLLWFLLSLLLALPLLKYILDFTSEFHSDMGFVFFPATNIGKLLASSLLLLPTVGVYSLYALRKRSVLDCFLGLSALLGAILALTFSAPAENQYKFHYPLTILFAIMTLRSLEIWRNSRRRGSRLLTVYVYSLILFAIVSAAYGANGLVLNKFLEKRTVQFDGIGAHPEDNFGGRAAAFQWISHNTPHDAIVIVGHVYTARSKLIHQRLNYVSKGGKIYKDRLPGFDQRIEDLHAFYDASMSADEYRDLLESMKQLLPGRAIYAVVMDPELSRDTMAQRGAQLVFENPPYGAHVYWLNPPATG